jgi:hypothetical protein
MGRGVGRAGKAVGEGTKSSVTGAEQKTVGKKSDEASVAFCPSANTMH